MTVVLPQFPVGQVYMPGMPVALRVFEPRYLNLMGELVTAEHPQFGIPLIPQRVEDGEAPNELSIGTLVRVTEFGMTEEFISVTGTGGARYLITRWLKGDPYPRAEIEYLPELKWDEQLDSLKLRTELEVRNLLARASQFGQLPWEADTVLPDDPVLAVWQLAGMLPVDPRELHTLLASDTLEELCELILQVCEGGQTFLDRMESNGPS